MVNGAILVMADASNLRLERRDPRIELRDRKGIEILRTDQCHRVSGTRRRGNFVGVHGRRVARAAQGVNGWR